jgi:hypothetical protein
MMARLPICGLLHKQRIGGNQLHCTGALVGQLTKQCYYCWLASAGNFPITPSLDSVTD